MRIIVISDTHNNYYALEKIVLTHLHTTDIFIHLGDGRRETDTLLSNFPEISNRFIYIRGNCDFGCPYSDVYCGCIEFHKILAVHGHNHNVKYSLETLKNLASENNCDIVLYGHTHQRFMSYDNGIYILNPGSASSPRDGKNPSYGVIDTTENGVLLNIAEL